MRCTKFEPTAKCQQRIAHSSFQKAYHETEVSGCFFFFFIFFLAVFSPSAFSEAFGLPSVLTSSLPPLPWGLPLNLPLNLPSFLALVFAPSGFPFSPSPT